MRRTSDGLHLHRGRYICIKHVYGAGTSPLSTTVAGVFVAVAPVYVDEG